MKANISLALNALLLIAVIYLFTQLPGSKSTQEATNTGASTEISGIVYLNADSLLSNYTYFRQKMEDLQARESAASQQIGQQMAALENEFKAVQKKIQQGLLSPSQIAGEEQRLGRKQQQLLAEQEQMSQVLMVETQQLNAEFQDELIELMDNLRAEKGYDYILQYGQGSGVLSAKGSYDITNDVLEILNKRHAGEAEASVDSLGN